MAQEGIKNKTMNKESENYKLDIVIKHIEYREAKWQSSRLQLYFGGKALNIKDINAFRRGVENIPGYGFHPDMIKFEKNTCPAFNNDYMALRLSLLPVLGVDFGHYNLKEKYWNKVKYNDIHREKHEDEKNLEVVINSHNKTDEIIGITTDDIKVVCDGVTIKPYSKEEPILIIKLRPGDEFNCVMKAAVGLPSEHVTFNVSRNSYYRPRVKDAEESADVVDHYFFMEGTGQVHEYDIMIRVCRNIMMKLQMIKEKIINDRDIKNLDIIKLNLDGEDHTMGEIINYEIQSHPNIIFSGNTKPDHLIESIVILVQGKNTYEAIVESMDNLYNKYSQMDYQLVELQEKYLETIDKKDKTKITVDKKDKEDDHKSKTSKPVKKGEKDRKKKQ